MKTTASTLSGSYCIPTLHSQSCRVLIMMRSQDPHQSTQHNRFLMNFCIYRNFYNSVKWPFCTNPMKCTRPNDYHVSNLAICMMDTIVSLPRGVHVKKFFGVPLLIFEREGLKDVWGCNKQEVKAMHEVVSTLSFMPQYLLVFMYPRHFVFWHAEKDTSHACIKIKCELMQITNANTGIEGGLSVSSWRKLSLS